MSVTTNTSGWMARGDELKCFSHRIAQARYFRAWERGERAVVAAELERIFARVHRLVALNWLSQPALLSELDVLDDGPTSFPEDWTEADFAITLPDGQAVSGGWLLQSSAWDDLLAHVLRAFLFMAAGEKLEVARRWRNDAMEATASRGLGLSELALGWARCTLLVSASTESAALRAILGDALQWLPTARDTLRARAEILVSARQQVLAPTGNQPMLLTFSGLRACGHVFQLDAYLARATTPATANLLTYLRCQDAAAPPLIFN